jgi:hypothetical protein
VFNKPISQLMRLLQNPATLHDSQKIVGLEVPESIRNHMRENKIASFEFTSHENDEGRWPHQKMWLQNGSKSERSFPEIQEEFALWADKNELVICQREDGFSWFTKKKIKDEGRSIVESFSHLAMRPEEKKMEKFHEQLQSAMEVAMTRIQKTPLSAKP